MIRELEKTGKTVEEAYEAACVELGVSMDDINVSYEILEMPTRKLFRSIPAKVLVKVETEDKAPVVEKVVVTEEKPVAAQAAPKDATPKKEAVSEEEVVIDIATNAKVRVAVEYLKEVIGCMGVVDVTMTAVQKGEATIIRIEGERLGALIGRRGETMESLSYLASLVANREEGDYMKLGLDVAGYRDKREQDLTTLAQRIGAKVIKNNRAFAMESMNPYERRLIHAAISQMEGLRSESIGDGKDRRVVIYSTAEGANNDFPETERNGRYNNNRGTRSQGGNRGGYRGGNSNRGGYRGNRNDRSDSRPPRTGAPRPKPMPERDFTPVDAASAAPVAPKRTERIDDMADFGFGKIEL
ncbi:MAG: RNA-binding cell elongation regulator Jag/EloR [Faecalibacterium sp.]